MIWYMDMVYDTLGYDVRTDSKINFGPHFGEKSYLQTTVRTTGYSGYDI